MRLSLKARQVAAVTSLVTGAVIVLGGLYVSGVVRGWLEGSQESGLFLARAIYHRAREVVAANADPYAALREDGGLRSILEAFAYSPNTTYAAIVDADDVVVAHSDASQVGERLPPRPSLDPLVAAGPWAQLWAIYADDVGTVEIQQPLLSGDTHFGTIRIGVSMLLARANLNRALKPAMIAALGALVASSLLSMLLAQSLLRPIHLIKSGLSRLGRGEFGVKLDLPRQDELGELGGFFNAVSAQLSADRTKLAGEKSTLESVVGRLEDAIAFFTPAGELLFANPAMLRDLPGGSAQRTLAGMWPADHPCRTLIEQTCADGQSRGPVQVEHGLMTAEAPPEEAGGERDGRLVMTHAVSDPSGQIVGVMLMCRDLSYLGAVESTIRYSHKLASLSRLTAGVAHEIKNSLHAMVIHLELLKQQMAGGGARPGPGGGHAAGEHIAVIANTLMRLDEMLQGLLRFTRPEELKLQPAALASMIEAIMPIVQAEARKTGVEVQVDCPPDLPMLRADTAMLQQALQNLALNACQAMPGGGKLRIGGRTVRDRFVEVVVEDTGAGIAREHLDKIFNLYFSTEDRRHGYRAVDGVPGRPVARRRDRGAVVARQRHGVPAHAAPGVMEDNRPMNRLACAAVVALAVAGSACVSAHASGEAGGPALAPPTPPPHTIIPVEIVEPPSAPPESMAPVPVIVRPSSRPPEPKPEKPAEKPAEKPPDPAPPPVTPPPAPPLQTTANVTEMERTIRARMAQAARDLDRTDYRALSTERREQYDSAKRFIQQADEALKVRNLVFAEQLADKAATLAAVLAQK